MIVLVGGLSEVAILACMVLAIPILLTIIGFYVKRNYSKTAKVLFILAILYLALLIVGFGICASML